MKKLPFLIFLSTLTLSANSFSYDTLKQNIGSVGCRVYQLNGGITQVSAMEKSFTRKRNFTVTRLPTKDVLPPDAMIFTAENDTFKYIVDYSYFGSFHLSFLNKKTAEHKEKTFFKDSSFFNLDIKHDNAIYRLDCGKEVRTKTIEVF